MQNNKNRSDFGDGHTDLSTEAVMPLKYLIRTRMVVYGQLVKPVVCLSDLYDVFLFDIVRDTRQISGP